MDKNNEIQKLRGISIIAVVIIHVLAQFNSILAVNNKILSLMFVDRIVHFAVPCFLFISGFVLAKYQKFRILDFYNKRLKSILIPYLFASLWYFVFWYVLDGYNPPIENLFKSLIHADAMYHLWYFKPLVELYLLYPVINFILLQLNKFRMEYILIILSFALQFYSQSVHPICYGMKYIFYFIIGIYFARKGTIEKIYKLTLKIIVILAAVVCLINGYLNYDWAAAFSSTPPPAAIVQNHLAVLLNCIMISITIIILINILARREFTIFIEIGKYSYGIYLYHVSFVFIFIRAADLIKLNNTK